MNREELRRAYQSFFKGEAGQNLLTQIQGVIVSSHEKAENQPELARDYVQRAKGAREIVTHINSVIAERKK